MLPVGFSVRAFAAVLVFATVADNSHIYVFRRQLDFLGGVMLLSRYTESLLAGQLCWVLPGGYPRHRHLQILHDASIHT